MNSLIVTTHYSLHLQEFQKTIDKCDDNLFGRSIWIATSPNLSISKLNFIFKQKITMLKVMYEYSLTKYSDELLGVGKLVTT